MSTDRPPTDRTSEAFWATELVSRRQALRVIGGTVVVVSGGLAVLLEACSPAAPTRPPATATLDVDPATLQVDVPVPGAFTLPAADGAPALPASVWLVKQSDGSIVAFDPRCTHQHCAVGWSNANAEFECPCHKAAFDVTGAVKFGPPPRPLGRIPATVVGGAIRLDVPAGFATPVPAA